MPIGGAGIGKTRGVQRLRARWSDQGSGSQRASRPAASPAARTGRTYGCNQPIDKVAIKLLPKGRPHMDPVLSPAVGCHTASRVGAELLLFQASDRTL